MVIEPLACPFCGGAAEHNSELRPGYAECPEDSNAWAHFYVCLSCTAVGGWAKSETAALRMWNMRVARDIELLEIP